MSKHLWNLKWRPEVSRNKIFNSLDEYKVYVLEYKSENINSPLCLSINKLGKTPLVYCFFLDVYKFNLLFASASSKCLDNVVGKLYPNVKVTIDLALWEYGMS